MKTKIFFLLIFLLSFRMLCAQEKIQTQIFDTRIASLQLQVNDNWRNPPLIRLNSNDFIKLGFDIFSSEIPQFYFVVEHYNSDWTKSELSDTDFIEGFNHVDIDDYQNSYNTLVSYTHCEVQLPNHSLRPIVSGNYVIRIYDYNLNDDTPLLMACFSVTEDCVEVSGEVSGITLVDYKDKHQQLKISVRNENLKIVNPSSEIKLVVQQNRRVDNQKTILTPLLINHNEIVYENNKDLIFEAGNHFRRFEMTTHQYAGMGIRQIEYRNDYYYVYLHEDKIRADKSYQNERDQFGRYIVRALKATDSNIEADYYQTCFKLKYDNPFPDGSLYIFGELSDYRFDERFKMQYDQATNLYTQSLLLKEGLYNYMYIFVPEDSTKGLLSLIEGSFYETRNEYLILVYYKSTGDRYERLIATTLLY
ncbi:MAG: DUF5103 domain-containing protein [Bacteroidales bacterium]